MSATHKYIKEMTELLRESTCGLSVDYLLALENGISWDKSRFEKYGEIGDCHFNAMQMALQHGWLYAEGWAVFSEGLHPQEHAWCVDGKGSVIDPTWANGHDYFGVVFELDFALYVTNETGFYGIFPNLHLLIGEGKKKKTSAEILAYLKTGVCSFNGETKTDVGGENQR